jgi:hypothetical protein
MCMPDVHINIFNNVEMRGDSRIHLMRESKLLRLAPFKSERLQVGYSLKNVVEETVS